MKSSPIIIEFCGIPYSRKTTTINKIGKLLRQKNESFKIIDEFRGDSIFYNSAKHTPDLNIVRSMKCISEIVTSIHSSDIKFILIDRGVFDTFCWISWLKTRKEISPDITDFTISSIKLLRNYSSKYRIVWMDMDPLMSIAQHGRQGSIVNTSTVRELQNIYARSLDEPITGATAIRFESGNVSSDIAAERLLSQLKL